MQNSSEAKETINAKLIKMNQGDILSDSNYKFIVMLHTRLVEANIPIEVSACIAAYSEFDMSEINEDDDYISQVASQYADYCVKIYQRLKNMNMHRYLDAPRIQKLFNP